MRGVRGCAPPLGQAMMRRVTFDYSGCAVLVTGGTSGIGLEIARAFAASGSRVHITGRRGSAAEYAEELAGFDYHRLDVFDDASVAALNREIDSLDVLVNNAGGVFARGKDEWTEQGFRDAIELNLMSHFRVSSACRAALARSRLEGGASGDLVRLGRETFAELEAGFGENKA